MRTLAYLLLIFLFTMALPFVLLYDWIFESKAWKKFKRGIITEVPNDQAK
jgi:hypothetical protein